MNLRRTLTILLSIACIAVYGIGLLVYERHKTLQDATGLVQHSHNVISKAHNLMHFIDRLVALQRGYLLTQDRNLYTAYFDAVSYFDDQYEQLHDMVADNPVQMERLKVIHADILALRHAMENRIALRQKQAHLPSNSLTHDVARIKIVIDDIRQQVNAFVSEEQKLLALRVEETRNREMFYFYSLFAASVLSVFILVLANGVILALMSRHRAVTHTLNRSEKDLAKMRERFELAMRGTSDGVFDWNAETNEIYFSPRFCAMLGYAPHEFPDTVAEFEKMVHPDDLADVWKRITHCLEGHGDYVAQFRIQHKDGSWHWHLARGATTAPAGEKGTRLVGAHTDITRQKTSEEHLRASNKELEEFTYIASHDLRAPLVNLKGFASEIDYAFSGIRDFVHEQLDRHPDHPDQERIHTAIDSDIPQSIGFIHSAVDKMEKLTRAILELSRVGRRKLYFEPVRTQDIAENCIRSLQHEITQKKVTVTCSDLPDITADAIAIEQVFMNILDNALKYLDPQRKGRITIAGTRSVSETTFRIQDNGRGIRPEDMNKVFEIFKRLGNNSKIPGEGMGMAYVQTILRRHNGRIWCVSEPDKGTGFFFSIPHHIEIDDAAA